MKAPPEQRLATGVRRLDHLLGGGLPAGTSCLVYGPPFLGKEILVRLCLLRAIEAGVPGILLHTNGTAADIKSRFRLMHKDFDGLEEKGLLNLVDIYSRSIGAEEQQDHIVYVDGPLDMNGISTALNNLQKQLQGDHGHHLLVLDSLSTLIAHSNAQAAFRFLQILLGRARQSGATCLVLMDQGMHSEAEVQTFKHIMDGALDLRDHAGKNQVQILGLGVTQNLGWIDYRFGAGHFEVTGSFAAGRIR